MSAAVPCAIDTPCVRLATEVQRYRLFGDVLARACHADLLRRPPPAPVVACGRGPRAPCPPGATGLRDRRGSRAGSALLGPEPAEPDKSGAQLLRDLCDESAVARGAAGAADARDRAATGPDGRRARRAGADVA